MPAPSLPEVLETVAQFAEATYPGYEYATVVVHLEDDLPDVTLPVTRRDSSVPPAVPLEVS